MMFAKNDGATPRRGDVSSIDQVPNTWTLAIDLGSSNTAAAIRHGTAEPTELRLDSSSTRIPSAVYLGRSATYVGRQAIEHAQYSPESFFLSPKRLLLEEHSSRDEEVLDALAALYREVYTKAMGSCGPQPPKAVILTHPHTVSTSFTEALRTAAVRGGIPAETIQLVTEPVAAAQFYARANELPPALLVVDVGGGTTDTSLIKPSSAGVPQVANSMGDHRLGGRSFDQNLIRDLANDYTNRFSLPLDYDDYIAQVLASEPVYPSIINLREQLSFEEDKRFEFLQPPFEKSLSLTYSKERLTEILRDDIARINELAKRTATVATQTSNSSPDETLHCFLTGGAAFTPALREALGEWTEVSPIDTPFNAVSKGALLPPRNASVVPQDPERSTATSEKSGAGSSWHPQALTRHTSASQRKGTVPRQIMTFVTVFILGALVTALAIHRTQHGDQDHERTEQNTSQNTSQFNPDTITPVKIPDDSPIIAGSKLVCNKLPGLIAERIDNANSFPGGNNIDSSKCSFEIGDHHYVEITVTPLYDYSFVSEPVDIGHRSVTKTDNIPNWYLIPHTDDGSSPAIWFAKISERGWINITPQSELENPKDEEALRQSINVVDQIIRRG